MAEAAAVACLRMSLSLRSTTSFSSARSNQILKSVLSTMYVVVVTHKGHSRCVDWSGLLAVHYEEE